MATVYGTSAASESLTGTSTADVILGAGGDNTIKAGAGDDRVFTGDGIDKIEGGSGDDTIFSGGGNDIVSGGDGNDVIFTSEGDDVLAGGLGNDVLAGGDGADTFQYGKGGFGHDVIPGFVLGEDKLVFYAGAVGNAKNITVSTVQDFIDLQNTPGVHLTYTVLPNNGVIVDFGSYGSIQFLDLGTALTGTPAHIFNNPAGSSGPDVLTGGGGVTLIGGGGNDVLVGNTDSLQGNAGDDRLVGGWESGGQEGNDTIFGSDFVDLMMSGGAGDDYLAGGGKYDTFWFSNDFGHDFVADLDFSEGDRLVFANAGPVGNATITSLAQLLALIDKTGATVTEHGDVATITFDATHSVTLMGYADEL